MKKELDKKSIILIAVSLLCIVGAIILTKLTLTPKEDDYKFQIDGVDVTENNDILEDIKVAGLDVTNQILYNKNNVTVYSAIIKNNTETDYTINKLYVVFTINDKEEKKLIINNSKIKKSGVFPVNIVFDRDVLSTTNIQYVIED